MGLSVDEVGCVWWCFGRQLDLQNAEKTSPCRPAWLVLPWQPINVAPAAPLQPSNRKLAQSIGNISQLASPQPIYDATVTNRQLTREVGESSPQKWRPYDLIRRHGCCELPPRRRPGPPLPPPSDDSNPTTLQLPSAERAICLRPLKSVLPILPIMAFTSTKLRRAFRSIPQARGRQSDEYV